MTILRARLGELPPIDFVPTIVGLEVTEFPEEQQPLMLSEFNACKTQAPHCLMRRAEGHAGMDDMASFMEKGRRDLPSADFADTVPMVDEVSA